MPVVNAGSLLRGSVTAANLPQRIHFQNTYTREQDFNPPCSLEQIHKADNLMTKAGPYALQLAESGKSRMPPSYSWPLTSSREQ
jgi:hypothetical protein